MIIGEESVRKYPDVTSVFDETLTAFRVKTARSTRTVRRHLIITVKGHSLMIFITKKTNAAHCLVVFNYQYDHELHVNKGY